MGAWIETHLVLKVPFTQNVAPCVGAWIETYHVIYSTHDKWSHPVWVRGLKLPLTKAIKIIINVAPCVGAWIETDSKNLGYGPRYVAPCVGAWIET